MTPQQILHLFVLKSGVRYPSPKKWGAITLASPVNYAYVHNYKTTGLNVNMSHFSVMRKLSYDFINKCM